MSRAPDVACGGVSHYANLLQLCQAVRVHCSCGFREEYACDNCEVYVLSEATCVEDAMKDAGLRGWEAAADGTLWCPGCVGCPCSCFDEPVAVTAEAQSVSPYGLCNRCHDTGATGLCADCLGCADCCDCEPDHAANCNDDSCAFFSDECPIARRAP